MRKAPDSSLTVLRPSLVAPGDSTPPRIELAQGTYDVIAEELAAVVQPEPAALTEQ
ncbi:hypothetical protein ACFV2X_47610 [Streptomyces sp. NPDC059679]|uniref:hypothetical protein n=1 Tax=Streptomyces sp. NPDC059679 TaxID=3346903 RepID=UPI0036A905F7